MMPRADADTIVFAMTRPILEMPDSRHRATFALTTDALSMQMGIIIII
jgi:hypothetical protein